MLHKCLASYSLGDYHHKHAGGSVPATQAIWLTNNLWLCLVKIQQEVRVMFLHDCVYDAEKDNMDLDSSTIQNTIVGMWPFQIVLKTFYCALIPWCFIALVEGKCTSRHYLLSAIMTSSLPPLILGVSAYVLCGPSKSTWLWVHTPKQERMNSSIPS